MNKQETIADIIAEMRGFKRYAASDSSDCRYVAYWLYQTFADRLEAAHKLELSKNASKKGADFGQLGDCAKLREAHTADPDWKEICARCRDGDIEPKCEYYGEPNGCNSPIYGEHPTAENSSAVGNVAKLRDALKEARVAIEAAKKKMGVDNPVILEIIDATLAKPPRNCDVGTAKEQLKRFKDFCRMISKDAICDGCPLFPQCSTLEHCVLAWMQMPYESEAADER